MSRARLATLVLALAFALAFGLWRQASFDPIGDAFENSLLDLRFRVRGALAPPPAAHAPAAPGPSRNRPRCRSR